DSSLGFSRTGPGAFSKAGLSLYPNPARSFVNLNMNVAESGKAMISIYDVSGKLVKAEQFNKDPQQITKNINVSSLNRGVYMVRLTIGSKTIGTEKFLKQ
ncbi:MAG TPA: T9SS type A sorting domain-containing protein, partial [Flavitalea sp.]|nr:T9SS type A sorting domain-containing protein [Flavitalea sp.]